MPTEARGDGNLVLTSRPRVVLFVCKGNICRSPAAEAIFNLQRRADWRANSCATHDYHVGLGAHPTMVDVARRRGLDLAGHRVRLVSEAILSCASLVIAMDRTVLERLRLLAPDCGATLLGADVEIADPYGGDDKAFIACLNHLQVEVSRLRSEI